MRRAPAVFLFILIILAFASGSFAQDTYFGKNKVRYKDFDWSYIQTRHFDIYFYAAGYETAKFGAAVMESSYVEITRELNYVIQERIPVFIYNSANDFQQTNIISSILPEGVGGFTEAFKKRIVVPFMGSYEDFRHVLHHELTHAVIYDFLFGNSLSSLLARQRLFNLPLWFAEGYAEYSSRHGWDFHSDMFVRDATINGYLAPPDYIGGYLAYRQGQAMVKFIADKYGEEKLGMILRKGKIYLTMRRAIKEALGITQEEFWEEFSREMKRRYWPDIADRKEASEIAKQLTKARQDKSYYNEKPVFTPDGDQIAFFTDRYDYTEIVLMDAVTGDITDRLVKSSRSGDLESLHTYVSGVSFSPDGRRMVFVAKSGGRDALFFYDIDKKEVDEVKSYDFYNVINPDWSPDGIKVAFSALRDNHRDLWVYDTVADTLRRMVDDHYDDVEPSWTADSKSLVFSSDRPHPGNATLDPQSHMYSSAAALRPGDFEYGQYNLHRIDIESGQIEPIDVGPGANVMPRVSPDGGKLAFVSNRNGIDNLYIAYLDSSKVYAITDIISGVGAFSWAPDGRSIAFSSFQKGAYDIFVLKDLVPAGDNGVLELTAFARGEYDLLEQPAEELTVEEVKQPDTSIMAGNIAQFVLDDEYSTYEVDPDQLAASIDSLESDTEQESDTTSTAPEADTTTTTAAAEDSVITETGVYDGEFVYIHDRDQVALDSMFIDIPEDDEPVPMSELEEPALFDSIPPPSPDGEFEIKDYKTKFTPDFVGGGFSYDTFFGLSGQSVLVFSDYLGNHQFIVATDLVNTIDQANIQGFYFYNRMRTRLGIGLFHTKNYYIDAFDHLFSDRFYGMQAFASRPFSTFSRLEFSAGQYFIDREFYDLDDTRESRNSQVTTAELSYVTDNILWGITGPVNGRRSKISVSTGTSLFGDEGIEYYAVEMDYRKYFHLNRTFTFAFRLAGGASFGATPKRYFLGGTTNYIGNRTVEAEVYEEENLYFSDVVTPLRGYEYYEFSGDRFAVMNLEFRYPMIDYFIMRFPLPLAISRVQGALFLDFGAAWEGDNFKGGTSQGGSRLNDIKSGFGFGMRANLGFLLLRWDLAWATDYNDVAHKPTSYFSFGADF